jgi:hypothetical protein
MSERPFDISIKNSFSQLSPNVVGKIESALPT